MTQLTLFPEAPGAVAHEPPCHPDSRCVVCYSAEEIADAESFDATFDKVDELDDEERFGEREPRFDPQPGFEE